MEYLTIQNITAFFAAILVLDRILRAIAQMTSTKVDDQAIETIDKARSWAQNNAPHFWAVIEQLSQVGAIPKAQKAAEFMLRLRAAYVEATGKTLPQAASLEAQTVAAGLSAAAKLPAIANPTPAPVSK